MKKIRRKAFLCSNLSYFEVTVLTHVLADDLTERTGCAKCDKLIVLIELAEGHAQAVVWKNQEHLIQQVRQMLKIQL